MARLLAVFVVLGMLPGCAGMHDWPSFVRDRLGAGNDVAGQFNFDWMLSGDRAVAPLQVFDDGRRTWLQFAAQQPVPAIFQHGTKGDRPLAYVQEGPYVVLSGVWSTLVLRGGRLKSTIRRVDADAASRQTPGVDPLAVEPAVESAVALAPTISVDHAQPANPVTAPALTSVANTDRAGDGKEHLAKRTPELSSGKPLATPEPALSGSVSAASLSSSSASALTAASFDLSDGRATERYGVSPQDATLRSALSRWARQAGWTFEAEHWAIDADIPIVGTASFESDFKLAVRELVASTELADRPAQPCFYSNQVLRIVPYAQPCDRTVGATRPS